MQARYAGALCSAPVWPYLGSMGRILFLIIAALVAFMIVTWVVHALMFFFWIALVAVASSGRLAPGAPAAASGGSTARPAGTGTDWPAMVIGRGGPAATSASGAAAGSLPTGQAMQRGPPRPLPSSLPGTRITSIPAASSLALVSTLRS